MPEPLDELELKRREMTLRETQFEHQRRMDESFPRKWGSVLFGAMATVAVGLSTLIYNHYESRRADQRAENEIALAATQAELEREREDRLTQLENTRLALDLYFENIEHMRENSPYAIHHLDMIRTLVELPEVEALVARLQVPAIQHQVDQGLSRTAAAASTPPVPVPASADPSAYTVYIQYPQGCEAAAQALQATLRDQGFRAPGIDEVDEAPDRNEIRYYGTAQEEQLDATLRAALGPELSDSFRSNPLLRSDLPGNIFEVWLGKGCLSAPN